MKTFFVKFLRANLLLFVSTQVFAQSDKYDTAMMDLFIKADTVKTVQGNIRIANAFKRIAEAEKNQWLPYYYAGLYNVLAALDTKDGMQIDKLANNAEIFIAKSDSILPKNAENNCVRAMIGYARIRVDMMGRGLENLMSAQNNLEKAIQYDKENPRAFFLLGQQAYNTPEQFGGSKQKALEYFEQALLLFEKQKDRENTYLIQWGKDTALRMKQACIEHQKSKLNK